MTFKQPQPTILLSSETNSEQILNQSSNSSKTNLCEICGDKAHCVNYGAISCPSCRAFFRRHGFHSNKIHSCLSNGECDVHIHNQQRTACISCRLAKCLAVGMNANFFRKIKQKPQKCHPIPKVNDTQIVQNQLPTFVPQLPTLDLLNRNRSGLTSSHWTLLSNVVHAYDNFSPISDACGIIEQLSRLPILKPSDAPITMKIAESVVTSMISLFRSIPDFQILTITEQRSLLERNMHGTSGFNFMFVARDSGSIDSAVFIRNTISVYGFETISRLKRLKDQLDSDSTLVKLMLITLAFSSHCSIMTMPENTCNDALLLGAFRLLGSQNVYVELLWKYMIYRYGYHATVLRFAYLIKLVVDMMDHITKSCMKVKTHQISVDDYFTEDKRSFVTSPYEHIPLWGNT